MQKFARVVVIDGVGQCGNGDEQPVFWLGQSKPHPRQLVVGLPVDGLVLKHPFIQAREVRLCRVLAVRSHVCRHR